MSDIPAMNSYDAVAGSMAECYVTIDGERYNMMQLYDFESSITVSVQDVNILGRAGKGKKITGWSGTWKGTAYYNQSVFRKWLLNFKKNHYAEPFEIQVTVEDPASSAGRQTITHSGCPIDSAILAKYSSGDNLLTEDISGTFTDWDMPESFDMLDGME